MNKQTNRMKQADKLVFILTVFLLSCFLIFEKYTWGKYALFVASILIFLIDMIGQDNKLSLRIGKFHFCFGAFVLFCFASSLWALSSSNALLWSISLLNNLICITLIYPYYSRKHDISMLLSIIMWASYIVAIYTISFYGLDRLVASSYSQYIRLGNDFSNINTVGMFCAFGLLVQIERLMYDKKINFGTVFAILDLIVIAATQSRKAILVVVIGTIIIAVMKSSDRRRLLKTIRKYVSILMVCFLFLFLIPNIPIFSGISERLNQLLPLITGQGQVDSGTVHRQKFIQLGIDIWLEYPIGGVGVNCPRIINEQVFGEYVYLHNNYVELLSGVGLIGLLIYYYMYYYILKNLTRYKNNNRRYYIFGVAWIILLFIMDYGMVSYYSKLQCFYLMVLFLNVRFIKHPCEETAMIYS